jgi:hypothetical protein
MNVQLGWFGMPSKSIPKLQLLMKGQLNRIFIETADATDPALKLKHKFMELKHWERYKMRNYTVLFVFFLLQDTPSHLMEYRAP